MKVAFFTLGCKVNQYETNLMIKQFKDNNYEIVDFDNLADVYVINSCSVTNLSSRKTRQIVSRAYHKNSNSIIVLCGCYAQELKNSSNKIKELKYVDILIGNEEKNDIIDIIDKYIKENKVKKVKTDNVIYKISDISNVKKYYQNDLLNENKDVRAEIKIEDGCNNFCSYCIIPYLRGRIRSRNIEDIVEEAQNLVKNGVKEIVLVGIEIVSYGKDLKENIDLINVIENLEKIDGLERIRLGSIYPTFLTDENILRLSKLKKLCNHFHLSIQSLDDNILVKMNRKYTSKYVINLTEKIRNKMPNVTFTCDIIVAFPSESDEEFENTLNNLKKIGFLHVHVFKYSKRKFTKAAVMENQIDGNIANQRSKTLIDLSEEMTKQILNNYIGKKVTVLLESYKNGYLFGFTSNYIKVKVVGDEKLWGTLVELELVSLEGEILLGKL